MATEGEHAKIVKQLVPQIQNRCRHFTGITNAVCLAGLRYEDVSAGNSLPCFKTAHTTCDRRSFLSDEEALAKADARATGLLLSNEGSRRAHEASKHVKGGTGVVECPKCGGKLHWSKAALNGHVWGKCETPGCLAWMQ